MDETTVVIRLLHLSECECHPGWFAVGEWDGDEVAAAWTEMARRAIEDLHGAYRLEETTTRTTVRIVGLEGGAEQRDRLQASEG